MKALVGFQLGEGSSRGLLRDCTTSPMDRFAALTGTQWAVSPSLDTLGHFVNKQSLHPISTGLLSTVLTVMLHGDDVLLTHFTI